MKKKSSLIALGFLYILLVASLVVDFFVLNHRNYFALAIFLVVSFISVSMYFIYTKYHVTITNDITNTVSGSLTDILKDGNIGILVYNEDYEITWLSSMFVEKGIKMVGEKLLVWLPELQELLKGEDEKVTVVINDDKYVVSKKDSAYVLFFKDITREYDLSEELKDISPVLGLVNFDNFDEAILNEDEIAYVNTSIKVPVLEYLRSYGVVYKTLRNNRLQLILNKRIYQNILDDRFSILSKVRRASKSGNVNVTLSLSFAYGSDDLIELDETAGSLLEVAETRGGDQVVVRQVGKDAQFFGGSSEAREGKSKLKVRVVANTLKRAMLEANNILVVGHNEADGDCVGASIVVSLLGKSLNKSTYIVMDDDNVEPMIDEVINKYQDVLYEKHNIISINEALSLLNDDSLVIMVDHHSKTNSSASSLLEKAKNIIIIDHHRRKADLDVDASFLYVEAGASSTTELLVEILQYFSKNIDISKQEANIMYIGILIDTNHFRTRTDSRTFDVAKIIQQYGADSLECEELIEEPYEMSKKRYEIIAEAKRYKRNIVIANCKKSAYPRSIASQAVDAMIEIKEIDAAFVIANLPQGEIGISARSNGKINVQLIMEKLGGGGHMTAAGYQSKMLSQDELYNDLTKAIDEYLESVKEDESNIIK